MTGGTEVSLGLITSLFPVRLTHGTVVPSARLVEQHVSGPGTVELQDWVWRREGSTYMEKLVMKAFLGSSISKVASPTVSALLTTRLVMTVWANRKETLESTVRL